MLNNKLLNKLIFFSAYHLIHNNILIGFIHKHLIKKFYYKNYIFNLQNLKLPLKCYSSFFFKTYEFNDRILIEKNLSKKNKCIIIGGGIGFISVLSYFLTKNTVVVFETNKELIKNLRSNLFINRCKFSLYQKNLKISGKKKFEIFNYFENFLYNSVYRKSKKKQKIKNIFFSKLKKLKKFNTLIIDAEGMEKHYISNIDKMPNIKYLIFEFHNDLFKKKIRDNLFYKLKKNNFFLKEKCFDSYFFEKSRI